MFSVGNAFLGSQLQAFLPISHVASSFTGVASRKRSDKNKLSNKENGILCAESFEEALKNFTETEVKHLWTKKGIPLFKQSFASILSTRHSLPWKVSYVSSFSFEENKNGFLSSEVWKQDINVSVMKDWAHWKMPLISVSSCASLGAQPRRGFKTKTQRTASGLGTSVTEVEGTSMGGRILGLRGRKEREKAKMQTEAEQSDKLKSLLADENLSPDEQQRLRVAFAEGYLAADPKTRTGSKVRLFNLFRDLLGIVLILAILFSFMGGPFRRVLIGSGNEVHPEEIDVTFDDVKGVDEAKQELQEIVEFLKNPEKFSVLGGKLPKGVLLVGPPGTGKTLLARAVAGEANVPFFHAAGPEFDEILVGQGARRVRDLFNVAKMRAPCVIFIDEIDSVGAKRTNSVLHPYANQTINQLLSEMDGFRQNEGVIVLGATNRRDDLDRALLRPGRFDVEIQVPIPDLKGRKEISKLYLDKIVKAHDVDLDVLARGSTGFTGADIENMINQAALRAAIDGAEAVTMSYIENARDKVLMGPERKSRIPDEEANVITAYHEGGHALVAYYTKHSHPLHKVTIIPRGPSLGHTAYIPEKEHYHVTKAQMLATMDTLMGGRAAEELIFGPEKITSGASSDLKQATALATQMVKEWGMSDKLGVRTFDEERNSLVVISELAPSTSEAIDAEIKRLLTESFERAKNILRNHSREHRVIAEALLKYETLDAEDLKTLLSGKEKIVKRKP
ncbi:ATP-dependent zinc metalloprotease YME1 homolog isoform X2 [Limulus polyphemus]|uniref:ATP-dependent zinc metalloprotease YME1 homolog isoform X2 n=1 Tax=Limulus polyphemus TaxID=6850 RepID=A0ABM1BGB9_LIMPO|nr:ATP-dependent zinc metalloprotease YME1 homolog isoform X2 [Limulus polyphemus]